MGKLKKWLPAALIAIVIAILAFLGWRVYHAHMEQTLHQAIADAWNKDWSEDMPAYLQYIDLQSDFEIDDIERGDPWVLTVTVCGLDVGGELNKQDPMLFSEDATETEMDQYLLSLAKQAELTYKTAKIYAWPEDGSYRIQFSETFIDAMTGGVYSYTLDLIEEITGGAK